MSTSGSDNDVRMVACPSCGAWVPANRFCQYCGVPLQRLEERPVIGAGDQESYSGYDNGDEQGQPDWDNPYASPQSNEVMTFPVTNPGREELISKINSAWKGYSRAWIVAMIFALFYFGSLIVLLIIQSSNSANHETVGIIGSLMGGGFLIFAIAGLISCIYAFILLYRLWLVVPANIAATSPVRAVGFLFIPFFNIYWMFIAFYRLANHYEELTRQIGDCRNRSVLAIFRCAIQLIPYIGPMIGPILTFILFKYLKEDAAFILRTYPITNFMPQPVDYSAPFETGESGDQNSYGSPEKFQNLNPVNSPSCQQYQPSCQQYPRDSQSPDKFLSFIIPVNTSGWSIIAGYLGLFSVLVFPAPLALIFGLLALNNIKKHPGIYGKGRAWFAIVMGSLVIIGVGIFFLLENLQ